jgi:threonine/homoserine/homoserine lactone efflux protein
LTDFIASLLAFILTSFAIEMTPGPNMTYIAVLSATRGRRAGFSAVAGIALGLLIMGAVAALGAAKLITEAPFAYHILRYGGAAYLVWVAWGQWQGLADEEELQSLSFRDGLVTNLLNPKAAVFYIVVLPQFVTDMGHAFTQIAVLTLVYVAVATAIHVAIVLAGSQAKRLLDNPRHAQVMRRAAALSMLGVAVWFLWSTRVS